jgi:hypothetical protein
LADMPASAAGTVAQAASSSAAAGASSLFIERDPLSK